MNIKTSVLLFFAFFAMLSCKTAEFGYSVFDISGMIYDFSNRPVINCNVLIGKRYKAITDINGRFTIQKVPAGLYYINVSKKGFESYNDEVFINNNNQIIYIRIPSQNQLMEMADTAMTINDLSAAEEMLERAYPIDQNNIEMLFYYAALKFRQKNYQESVYYLENAQNLGSKDHFIEKLMLILKEKINESE